MRWMLVLVGVLAAGAQPAGQQPDWHADVSAAVFAEAWDRNRSSERLGGVVAGVDRRVWRALGARVEGSWLRVAQDGPDASQAGLLLALRTRLPGGWRPVIDVGAGISQASAPVPPGGTRFNYLLLLGAGVEPGLAGRLHLSLLARWFHVSNNGREGRGRNPDIQALGASVGLGWRW